MAKRNRSYTKFTPLNDNKTALGRKINRELCDPNRIYEGRPVDIGAIKAVRLA